jgi:hypothetical protein
MNNDIPIVCTLNDDAFRERERSVIQKLMPTVLDMTETEEGFVFRFPSDDASFRGINEFIVLERKCCPFLDFKMTVGRGNGDILLELSGGEGVKEFINQTFIK